MMDSEDVQNYMGSEDVQKNQKIQNYIEMMDSEDDSDYSPMSCI